MRKVTKTLLVMIGGIAVLWALDTAFTAWAWRSRNPAALRLVKRVNKHVLNPVMLRFSGRSGLTATVHHRGRRSGTAYATPVVAHRSNDEVIIPLPYGPNVDWLRNILAAERAVVDLGGRNLVVDQATVVGIDTVIGRLPTQLVRTIRFNKACEAARLHVAAHDPVV